MRQGALYAALFAGLLAGCAANSITPSSTGQDSRAAAPRKVDRNLSGFPLAFKQGYADACDSTASGRRRDESRYKGDMDYLMGWNDGFAVCRR